MSQGSRLYRAHAADGTTHLDLLLATYDRLAEDLRLCAASAAAGDITARCRETSHALLLIGHLESWIPFLNERPLQQSLEQFYIYLRAELLRLQASADPQALLDLSMKVCETRAAWHAKAARATPVPEILSLSAADADRTTHVSWSA